MQEFIARMNIERFRRLIAEEPEAANRARLERMLVEEQEKLRACRTHPDSIASQDQGDHGSDRQRP